MMKARAYLLMTNVDPGEWAGAIDEQRKLIGRAQTADIRIPSWFRHVSRRHAETWADAHGHWISDVGSQTGTHINGVWLEAGKLFRIAVGDRIWLGGVELRVFERIPRSGDEIYPSLDQDEPESVDGGTDLIPSRRLLRRLSTAELEVLQWLCRGYVSNQEIGRMLHRSPHTIRTQVASILQKLQLHSRADLVGWIRRTHGVMPELAALPTESKRA